MSQKYLHLARKRELEDFKASFVDAMTYLQQSKIKPQHLLVHIAHLKTAPSDWDNKKFGE